MVESTHMLGKIVVFYHYAGGSRDAVSPMYAEVLRVNPKSLRIRWLATGLEQRVPRTSYYGVSTDRDEWGDLPYAPPDAT